MNKIMKYPAGIALLVALVTSCRLVGEAFAEGGMNANTGLASGSIIGNNSMQANNTGIAVNGEVKDTNLNNNQNTNANIVRPVITAPTQTQGGSSALILPRNPLPMPNASLGRSNFGLQAGVQNNPGISALTGGSQNALGWFLQAGLTIPFGRIPGVYKNQSDPELDELRRQRQDEQRRVFGNAMPGGKPAKRSVKGKVIGLNAYNYTALPSGKLGESDGRSPEGVPELQRPRVLALTEAEVFSKPLNTGKKIGMVETGGEYPYLGHTRSGWIKVLLPNGAQGWTSTRFEYIKFDYTEIDNLAVNQPDASDKKQAAAPPVVKAFQRKGSS